MTRKLSASQEVQLKKIRDARAEYRQAERTLEEVLRVELDRKLSERRASIVALMQGARDMRNEQGRHTPLAAIREAYGTKDHRTITALLDGYTPQEVVEIYDPILTVDGEFATIHWALWQGEVIRAGITVPIAYIGHSGVGWITAGQASDYGVYAEHVASDYQEDFMRQWFDAVDAIKNEEV